MAFKRMINAVDTHAGTPMRVITGGVPHIPGNSVYEKMKWLETNDDQLRKLMLRKEIYATAAAAGAALFVAATAIGVERDLAISAGALTVFAIRGAAIVYGWSLPAYKARPGREYPDRRA